jgi:opacity protein-like surface antigen
MPPIFPIVPRRVLGPFFTLALLLPALKAAHAGEIELKSLNTVQNDPAAKRKYGPYAGFFGGANNSFSGQVNVAGINYDLNGRDNSAVFGFEVGKTWRSKKMPLSLSMEFEGSFMQTDFTGTLSEEEEGRVTALMERRSSARPPDRRAAPTPLPSQVEEEQAIISDGTLAAYEVDMNSAMFMVNGSISLDLWRYRARIGKVLGGLKPYVGGGFGGGQVWFRNNKTLSRAQVEAWRSGGDVLAASGSTATPFAIDEFVTAWQWFGGIEYCWEDKYSVFAEFRHFYLGDMEDLTAFETKGYTIGFRYRY